MSGWFSGLSSCLQANPSLKLKYTLVFTPFNVAVVEVVCAIYGEEWAYVLICALCVAAMTLGALEAYFYITIHFSKRVSWRKYVYVNKFLCRTLVSLKVLYLGIIKNIEILKIQFTKLHYLLIRYFREYNYLSYSFNTCFMLIKVWIWKFGCNYYNSFYRHFYLMHTMPHENVFGKCKWPHGLGKCK